MFDGSSLHDSNRMCTTIAQVENAQLEYYVHRNKMSE